MLDSIEKVFPILSGKWQMVDYINTHAMSATSLVHAIHINNNDILLMGGSNNSTQVFKYNIIHRTLVEVKQK